MKPRIVVLALAGLLCGTAQAGMQTPAAASFACPYTGKAPDDIPYDTMIGVYKALVARYKDALGPAATDIGDPKVAAKVASSRIDGALAEVSGCAALIDIRNSCAQFFDPELGDPLSVFMDMKRSAPLRRQFEDAIAHLARPGDRRAAQACIERVGRK